MKKKILSVMLAGSVMIVTGAFAMVSCGSDSSKGDVAVFYYTFSDTYISTVRTAMDNLLKSAGYSFQDYDANGNQTTQTEQVQTAITKGASSSLIVNVVDTGSNDAAQNIVNLAKKREHPGNLLQPFG